MRCPVCGSMKYIEILNRPKVRIWTNSPDTAGDENPMYQCCVNQCEDCGHVYQPLDAELKSMLRSIYQSENAQASTAIGKGNWGAKRGLDFLDKIDPEGCESAVEIGCANGYLLRQLKDKGFKELVGIDPSIAEDLEGQGILFLKDFADEKLKLPRQYDLIFSSSVFEHVDRIGGILDFCRNTLKAGGRLFFSVPNAARQLEDGDPGLFLHQHLHYYTPASISGMLSGRGFRINSISTNKDAIYVDARLSTTNGDKYSGKIIFYDSYQQKLDKILARAERILCRDRVIVHGANNALNNILGWLGRDFKFILADGDETKHGRSYLNKSVTPLSGIAVGIYDTVLIIPLPFYETIKSEYINRGFTGAIESLIPDKDIDACHAQH